MEFHAEKEDRLLYKMQKLEKTNEGLLKDFQKLQKESFQRLEGFRSDLLAKKKEIQHLLERRGVLLEEKKEWKRRFCSIEAQKKSAESRLRKANMELEALSQAEVQKSQAWRVVTAMAKRSAARLQKKITRGGDDEDEEEIEAEEGVIRKMVQPFAEALESIERAFEGKEQEMEELRRVMGKALSGKGGGEEEMDFVDVGALPRTDGV